MAKEKDESIFDIKRLRELIELMEDHELNEVDLKQAEQRIRLRRGAGDAAPVVQTAAPARVAAVPATPAEEAVDDSKYILCEAVGTFYSCPKPGKPAFVKVGETVTPDTIVCLIEAMKMFNEVPAGVSGKIVEMLVKDGDAVDHGKRLFRIE